MMARCGVDVARVGASTTGITAYREAAKYPDRIALIDGGPLATGHPLGVAGALLLSLAVEEVSDHLSDKLCNGLSMRRSWARQSCLAASSKISNHFGTGFKPPASVHSPGRDKC